MPPTQTRGIRPAKSADITAIASLHRTMMRESIVNALSTDLDDDATQVFATTDFDAAWAGAVQSPPTPAHHVMVAYDDDKITGFAAIEPSALRSGCAHIVALAGIDEEDKDRLLNAVADISRAARARGLTMWAISGDTPLVRMLDTSGFAPTGEQRSFAVGKSTLTEHLWWTTFAD